MSTIDAVPTVSETPSTPKEAAMATTDCNDLPNNATLAFRWERAFQSTADDRAALAPQALAVVNLDIPAAVAAVIGAVPKLRAIRAELVAHIVGFDTRCVDRLEDYALGAGYAHAAWLSAAHPPSLVDLNAEAIAARDTLHYDATALARRGLLDPARLTDLKGIIGYKNVAFDLMGLVQVLRESWPTIASKTAIQPAELERAAEVADRLVAAVGAREQSPSVAQTVSDRQRAFTLLVDAYDEVRRGVSFLRWHEGDADAIAPSLYAGRGGSSTRTAKARESSATPDATPSPAPPAPPTPPAAPPSATALPVPHLEPPPGGWAPVGMPGSNPFTT
jgi:hypothetical protein